MSLLDSWALAGGHEVYPSGFLKRKNATIEREGNIGNIKNK
jgi:hypothetical protein